MRLNFPTKDESLVIFATSCTDDTDCCLIISDTLNNFLYSIEAETYMIHSFIFSNRVILP